MKLAEKYMKKAGFSSGKCEGSACDDHDGRRQLAAGVGHGPVVKDQLEKLGFNVNLQAVDAQTPCTRSSAQS